MLLHRKDTASIPFLWGHWSLERMWLKKMVEQELEFRSLVPITLSWKSKDEGVGKGGKISILIRTLVFAKEKSPIQIYLWKIKDKDFTGASNWEFQGRFGSSSAEFRDSVTSLRLRLSFYVVLLLSSMLVAFSDHLSSYCGSGQLQTNKKSSSLSQWFPQKSQM